MRRWAALAAALLSLTLVARARAEPVRYVIDGGASELRFLANSLLQKGNGRFHRFSGEVVADPADLARARVSLSIDTASIDTANRKRDDHLRSEDFFWVTRHPAATLETIRVEVPGGGAPVAGSKTFSGRLTVVGRLTIRGITREITVPVETELTEPSLMARGELTINRRDYALSYQSALNPIEDAVRIVFSLVARPVSR